MKCDCGPKCFFLLKFDESAFANNMIIDRILIPRHSKVVSITHLKFASDVHFSAVSTIAVVLVLFEFL